ncbi:MAG: aspartate aminotransferase family protein [Bacteroidia bacterium]
MLSPDFFKHVAQTSPEPIPLSISHAKGVYLYGKKGEKIIDFISGICVNNLGHGVPEVIEAIQNQAEKYLHPNVYGDVDMEPQTAYARALCEALGPGFDQVYFLGSGAEAVEGSLKIAKKFTGRTKLVACEQSYHGSSHGALSVTGADWKKQGYGPLLPNVHFIPFNDKESLQKIDEETAAIIIEPIQGAGGIIIPDDGYLQAVKNRCQEVGALMILDEIQTGFGRTGSLFAHQDMGFRPDIILLAKALGGGMPLGAFVTRTEVMNSIRQDPILGHISTFGGHAVCCAAGLASFKKLRNSDLIAQVKMKEQWLIEGLQQLDIEGFRGKGLLYAALFKDFDTANTIRAKALELGLLTIGFLNIPNGLRIAPPLTISKAEMDEAFAILSAAITEVK